MSSTDRPALRARMGELHRRLGRLLAALNTTRPTVAGFVYQLRTRCGRSPCVCTQGELHRAWCISYPQGHGRRLRTLPPERVEEVQALTRRYQYWRKVRAELNRTFRRLLEAFDRVERSLRISPSRALPKAGKRGRSRNAHVGSFRGRS